MNNDEYDENDDSQFIQVEAEDDYDEFTEPVATEPVATRGFIFKPEPSILEEDMNHLPMCAEKYILSLIWKISSTLHHYNQHPESTVDLNKTLADSIRDDYSNLLLRLREECLQDQLNSPEYRECFDKLESLLSGVFSSKSSSDTKSFYEWANLIDRLKFKLLKGLRPLDIESLFRLIHETDEAATIIRDKEIILLLGKTGSGKSTTAHYLAGTKLVRKLNGLVVHDPVTLKDGLEFVNISMSSNSETKCLTPVKADLTRLLRKPRVVYLCDTPGFDDTAGAEVDIANTYGMIQAIQQSNSVRPVAVLNYDGVGGRMEGPIELAQLLSRMLPHIDEEIDKLFYVFTKFPDDVEPHQFLEEASKRDGLKDTVKTFILEMAYKTEVSSYKIRPLDPKANEKANALLRTIVAAVPIDYPKEKFSYFITDKSTNELKNQLGLHEKAIDNAIVRCDYELIDYKLGQLKLLRERLSFLSVVNTDLQQINKKLEKHFDQIHMQIIDRLQNQIKNQNKLTEDDIAKLKSAIEMFVQVKPLIKKYFDESNQPDYESSLNQALLRASKDVSEQIKNLPKQAKSDNLFENAFVLMKSFKEIAEPVFKDLSRQLTQEMNKQTIDFRTLQEPFDFQSIAASLETITKLEKHCSILSKYFTSTDAPLQENACSRECCTFFLDLLKNSATTRTDMNQKYDESFIANVNTFTSYIDSSIMFLSEHISKIELNDILQPVYAKISKRVEDIAGDIKDAIGKEFEKDTLKVIKPLFDDIKMLRRITEIANSTNDIYQQVVNEISDRVMDFNKLVAEAFQNFKMGKSDANFERVSLFFQVMADADWLNQIRPNLCSNALKACEQGLVRQIKELHEDIKHMRLDEKNYANLEQGFRNFAQIVSLKPLGDTRENLEKLIEEGVNSFKEKIQETFKSMENAFSSDDKTLIYYSKKLASIKTTQAPANDAAALPDVQMEVKELEELIGRMNKFRSDYFFPRINGSYFESSLKFLEFFENQQASHLLQFKSEAGNIRKLFKTYLFNYSKFVDNEFNNCLMLISEHKRDKEELKPLTTIMITHLRDMQLLKNQYSHLYEQLNAETNLSNTDMIEHLNSMLNDFERTLDDKLKECFEGHDQKLSLYLEDAQLLSYLDPYRVRNGFNKLFSKIYNEHSNQKFQDVQARVKSFGEYLEKKHYGEIARELNLIEGVQINANSLRQMNHVINVHVRELIDKAISTEKKINREFDIKQIEDLSEILGKLVKAQKELFSLLDDDTSKGTLSNISKVLKIETKQAIDSTLESIRKSLTSKVSELLDAITKSIGNSDFNTAEIGRDKYEEIMPFLGDYIQTEVDLNKIINASGQSAEQDSNSLRAKFAKIELAFEKDLNRKIEEYAKMPVTDYETTIPKILIAKLKNAAEKKMKYKEALEKINDSILSNIRAYIRGRDNANNQSDFANKKKRIEEVKLIQHCLPTDLSNEITTQITRLESDLSETEKEQKKNIENWISQDYIDRIKHLLTPDKSDGMGNFILDEVKKRVTEITVKLANEIRNTENMAEVANLSIKLSSYYEHFKDKSEDILWDFKRAKQALKTKYESLNIDQINMFSISIDERGRKEIAKRFSDFLAIVQLSNQTQDLIDIDSNILNAQLEKLLSFFHNNLRNFEAARANLHEEGVEESLKIASQWTELFNSLSNCRLDNLKHVNFEVLSYSSMIRSVLSQMKEFASKIRLMNFDGDEMKYDNERNDIFQKLKQNIIFFKALEKRDQLAQIHDDLARANSEIQRKLLMKHDEISNQLMTMIVDRDRIPDAEFKRLGLYYDILVSFETIELENSVKKVPLFDTKIKEHLNKAAEAMKVPGMDAADIARKLVYITKVSQSLPYLKDAVNQVITDCLKALKSNPQGLKLIDLIDQLEKSETGAYIIAEFEIFKGEIIRGMYKKTNNQDVDYVLRHLTGDGLSEDQKGKLRNRYETYVKTYDELISRYIARNTVDDLIEDTNGLVKELKQLNSLQTKASNAWSDRLKEKLPAVIAHISALWTLKNKKYHDEAQDASLKKEYLLKPHPAQIIALFRLLGIGYESPNSAGPKIQYLTIQNNLIQVNTGEGKSVILAIASIVLALFDFSVDCACYSKYLSKRDFDEFQGLFDSLNVKQLINYGTFTEICEKLVNSRFDIREKVLQLITNNSIRVSGKTKPTDQVNRFRVLLVDEVDVFFNKDFFGQLYVPSAKLSDPLISAVLDFIWKNREEGMSFSQLQQSEEFKKCEEKFSNWMDLIGETFKNALSDLETYKSHSYLVVDDKIAYKEHDGISFDTVYGYKTLFAYYHECEKGKITPKSCENSKSILINTGCFSYCEIPLNFKAIIGVSGTLSTIQSSQKEVIKNDYTIALNTILPSVYGRNKQIFRTEEDILISKKENFYLTLLDEINKRLSSTANPDIQRAVLVFFETKESLENFYNFELLKDQRKAINIIKEETSDKDKIKFIREATQSGQVTFLTRSHGRGIDFVCRSQIVLNNGGVHVIQTFLSENKSEEIQIRGRSARQGEDGSYSMVLIDEDLEKFLGRDFQNLIESMINQKKIYETLDTARNECFEKNNAEIIKSKQLAKADHNVSKQFLDDLEIEKISEVKKFLLDKNRGKTCRSSSKSRTICLMDATGSMTNLLTGAKNTVITMFSQIIDILKGRNLPIDIFELQFVVYRDYDNMKKILEYSGWQSDPMALRTFMDSIQPMGNSTNEEAVEIGLWYANEQAKNTKIAQVILIGDAPAKTIEDIKRDRARFGGELTFWSVSDFGEPTDYIEELKRLKEAKIPVHTFYVSNYCKENFEAIAQGTNGKCAYLNVDSPTGSEELTRAVCIQVLADLENKSGNSNLVTDYHQRYGNGKSYQKSKN